MAGLFVSLDGVMESSEKWKFPYFNDEMGEAIGVAMAATDAMLLGRLTYQEFASYWPIVSAEDQPFAVHMNNPPKYVVSTTLQKAEWSNSTLIKGNVAEEIARLKQQPGTNIGITGSATLVQSLLQDNLLDELGLMIHPVVVGAGRRLFKEGGDPKGLTLVDSKTVSTGVVSHLPASREGSGSIMTYALSIVQALHATSLPVHWRNEAAGETKVLRLISSTTFGSGAVVLSYQPAGKEVKE